MAPIESKPWLRRFDTAFAHTNQIPTAKSSVEEHSQQHQRQIVVAAVTTATTTTTVMNNTTTTTTTTTTTNGMSGRKSPTFPSVSSSQRNGTSTQIGDAKSGTVATATTAAGSSGDVEFQNDDDPLENDEDDDLMDFMASVMDENNSNTLSPPPPADPPPPSESSHGPSSRANKQQLSEGTTFDSKTIMSDMNVFASNGSGVVSHQRRDRTPPIPEVPTHPRCDGNDDGDGVTEVKYGESPKPSTSSNNCKCFFQ